MLKRPPESAAFTPGLILITCPDLPLSVQKDPKCSTGDYQGDGETVYVEESIFFKT